MSPLTSSEMSFVQFVIEYSSCKLPPLIFMYAVLFKESRMHCVVTIVPTSLKFVTYMVFLRGHKIALNVINVQSLCIILKVLLH
mmetsp:Transcript_12817/g.28276  ORF Transcript_12817/g.28276 Transcript_12817/m.28276 type:complete len:84 (-) Transcript_12817:48-299(-)